MLIEQYAPRKEGIFRRSSKWFQLTNAKVRIDAGISRCSSQVLVFPENMQLKQLILTKTPGRGRSNIQTGDQQEILKCQQTE
jgi:hypothetical protein